MERRKFFRNMGLVGGGSGLLTQGTYMVHQGYAGSKSLADATNEQGETAFRIALSNEGDKSSFNHIQVKVK